MLPLNAVWIDSEEELVRSFSSHLQAEDCVHFHAAEDGDLLSKHKWSDVDLVLLEVKAGNDTALEIVSQLRAINKNLPIILVSSDCDKNAYVKAINLGVNGCIEKPVQVPFFKEMIDRHRIKQFELRLNEERKAVYSQKAWVDLTSTEYKILETLQTAGRRLTRSELQASVWPNSSISENNLDTHLTNLKRKIPELVTALNVKRGLGYFLVKNSQ